MKIERQWELSWSSLMSLLKKKKAKKGDDGGGKSDASSEVEEDVASSMKDASSSLAPSSPVRQRQEENSEYDAATQDRLRQLSELSNRSNSSAKSDGYKEISHYFEKNTTFQI